MANRGSITKLRNGRFWVRAPGTDTSNERRGLGTYATREEAAEVLAAARTKLGQAVREALTTNKFAAQVLDMRELDGLRSVDQERARYRVHLEPSTIGTMPLRDVQAAHVAELVRTLSRKKAADKRGDRKISRATVQRCIALLSTVFSEALQRGLVERNPCTGIRVRRDATATTKETWAYLTPDKQKALAECEEIPIADRLLMRFAIGTGLRQGEQWSLELRDLHAFVEDPFVFVRFGSKGKAPKSGKTRRVPLFGDALVAAREWLALLPTFSPKNPEHLVFPTARGNRRGQGKPFGKFDGLRIRLARIGITDRVRWHDLRHTCASSLVAGWWGRRWTLEEVCAFLGHSSIVVTQKYAHLGETALKAAARETAPGYALVTGGSGAGSSLAAISNDFNEVGRPGLEPGTYGLKGPSEPEESRALARDRPPSGGGLVTSLAETYLELLKSGRIEQALAVGMSLANAQIASSPALVEPVTEKRKRGQ